MSEELAKYKTPFNSPNANLARKLMDHISLCRPLVTDDELAKIRQHSNMIQDKWDAYGDSKDNQLYDLIMEEETQTPFLDKQQASYEAYLDSVIKNFTVLKGVSRKYLSGALHFYFDYYFGEGGPNSSETARIIYTLDKVL